MLRNIKCFFWLSLMAVFGFIIHLSMYITPFIYPFSDKLYRRINYWSSKNIWGFWGYIIEDFHQVPIHFSGDDFTKNENAIIICNHQSWSDILVIIVATRKAAMTANLKWMAKHSLRYIPLVGWGMHFIDCIFLKRDWAKDKKAIEKTFGRIISKEIPFWLAIFPEGTRKNPEKLRKSQRFLRQRRMPNWQHVMTPKPKGVAASLQGLQPKLEAMYSLTIHYRDKKIPHPGEMFAGLVSGIDVRVQKITKETIDTLVTDQDVKKFLYDDFAEKEQWLAAKKLEAGC